MLGSAPASTHPCISAVSRRRMMLSSTSIDTGFFHSAVLKMPPRRSLVCSGRNPQRICEPLRWSFTVHSPHLLVADRDLRLHVAERQHRLAIAIEELIR